ncbi:MAG TPA: DUF4830 domain-containing protein [Candidatus Egerieicola pullicola]|uniref:DUF4830 domain-containing protein n=1 Tax=Candidatus Egerieicola pullicola TaxID=2840775 RepID=A0A9D1ALA6_9FIRM|nr:DUF4830 domain-containing protein [Candidatus Egerieicola pullicola]
MFVCAVKATWKRVAVILLVAAAIIGLLVVLLGGCQSPAEEEGAAPEPIRLTTVTQMVEWLAGEGIEVDPDSLVQDTVTIPQPFDDIYTQYNQLQLEAGFDLTPYQGFTADRSCFTVLNYPNQEEGVLVHLLCWEGELIGGDLCSVRLDGFLTGLIMPEG